jgi:hypothetical protein
MLYILDGTVRDLRVRVYNVTFMVKGLGSRIKGQGSRVKD